LRYRVVKLNYVDKEAVSVENFLKKTTIAPFPVLPELPQNPFIKPGGSSSNNGGFPWFPTQKSRATLPKRPPFDPFELLLKKNKKGSGSDSGVSIPYSPFKNKGGSPWSPKRPKIILPKTTTATTQKNDKSDANLFAEQSLKETLAFLDKLSKGDDTLLEIAPGEKQQTIK